MGVPGCVKWMGVPGCELPDVSYAAGRSSTKTVGSKITRYVYAGTWIILEEESTNSGQSWGVTAENYQGTSVDDVVMSRRLDIADLDQDQSTSDWVDLYHHKNIQGSTMFLTLGSTGAVVESYHYSSFGKTTIQDRSGNVANAPPSGNAFLYTGREYDSETGYYHYRARTYDPNTGDFLQEDPKGLAAAINPQGYVVGNPIAFTDPFGTATIQGTPEHPFYCSSKQEWIALASLNPGDLLAGRTGPARVISTRPSLFKGYVYNLSVLRANSYRVGPLGLLVHNTYKAKKQKKKHTPGKGHRRKSDPQKRKRQQEKARKKREAKQQAKEAAEKKWAEMSAEAQKMRQDLNPDRM